MLRKKTRYWYKHWLDLVSAKSPDDYSFGNKIIPMLRVLYLVPDFMLGTSYVDAGLVCAARLSLYTMDLGCLLKRLEKVFPIQVRVGR